MEVQYAGAAGRQGRIQENHATGPVSDSFSTRRLPSTGGQSRRQAVVAGRRRTRRESVEIQPEPAPDGSQADRPCRAGDESVLPAWPRVDRVLVARREVWSA